MNIAADTCRALLARDPSHVGALHLLGAAEQASGRGPVAIELLARAVELQPNDAQLLANFGAILAANNHLAQSIEMLRRALAIQPDIAEAHANLGNALKSAGNAAEAEVSLRGAIALRPDYATAYYNLAAIRMDLGDAADAIRLLEIANRLKPNWAEALNNLGSALQSGGRLHDAMYAFRKAIAARGNFAEAYSNLGSVLGSVGAWDEAVQMGRMAATLNPDSADILTNFAGSLRGRGDVEEAVQVLQRAIHLKPNSPHALASLALVKKDRGELESSVALFRQSLQLRPDAQVAGTLLWTLHYLADSTPESLWIEHRAWNETYARPLASQIKPYRCSRDPHRKLRIGYCSGDFNGSPIGRFIWPTIRQADRERFDLFCYSDTRQRDARTEPICAAMHWREVDALSDAQLADLIHDDEIDILIDLAQHTGRNRMLAFARKPAPVQVAYLNYLGTTGLATMDYRITDPYVRDEAGEAAFYAETAVELPRSYWCYEALPEAGDASEGPAHRNGFITFGCLNGFGKVTGQCISMWCEILDRLPTSRLLLHCLEGSHCDFLLAAFRTAGIASDRLEFAGRTSTEKYFRSYDRIDIALDSFPYPGGTTTCDALWMGVPVINRVGKTAASRGGCSILSNVGLADLATHSGEEYVAKAVALAGNQDYLAHLRQNLRAMMLASPLCDAIAHTRDIETAFRTMWHRFCRDSDHADRR